MRTTDLSALYREDAELDEVVEAYQHLVDTGQAWQMEGHVGRTAMALIEDGYVVLGPEGHRDFWGNYVPGRDEVEPGTLGSPEYAAEKQLFPSQHVLDLLAEREEDDDL